MPAEQNKAVVHRLVHDLFNRTDVQAAAELLVPDYVEHDPILGRWSGAQGLQRLSRSLRAAFPDGHMTINDQFVEGDRVVTRWAFRGTQLGALEDIPASGEGVWVTGISIHRVSEGRIREGWTSFERVRCGAIESCAASLLYQVSRSGREL